MRVTRRSNFFAKNPSCNRYKYFLEDAFSNMTICPMSTPLSSTTSCRPTSSLRNASSASRRALHLTHLHGNAKRTRHPTLTTAHQGKRACSITNGMGSRSCYRSSSATSAIESVFLRNTTTSSSSSCLKGFQSTPSIVQSAYVGKRERSLGGRMAKKITFRALVSKVLAGERPKPPP